MEHMGGKYLSQVRPVGNGLFEAVGMARYVVECVTLLAVSIFALCCPWYVVERCGECTSGMIVLSWRSRVVEVCGVDWLGRC